MLLVLYVRPRLNCAAKSAHGVARTTLAVERAGVHGWISARLGTHAAVLAGRHGALVDVLHSDIAVQVAQCDMQVS